MSTINAHQGGIVWHHTSDKVREEVLRWQADHTLISANSALAIAAGWQAPAGHGLTFAELASRGTGEVDALLDAIEYERPHAAKQGTEVVDELDALQAWVLAHVSAVTDTYGTLHRLPGPYESVEEIIAANEAVGQVWFSPNTMTFFDGQVDDEIFGGRLFVSSEKPPGNKREYRVRVADDTGRIASTDGEYTSLRGARLAAQRLASASPTIVQEDTA